MAVAANESGVERDQATTIMLVAELFGNPMLLAWLHCTINVCWLLTKLQYNP
jgi:hypothetical protein